MQKLAFNFYEMDPWSRSKHAFKLFVCIGAFQTCVLLLFLLCNITKQLIMNILVESKFVWVKKIQLKNFEGIVNEESF